MRTVVRMSPEMLAQALPLLSAAKLRIVGTEASTTNVALVVEGAIVPAATDCMVEVSTLVADWSPEAKAPGTTISIRLVPIDRTSKG